MCCIVKSNNSDWSDLGLSFRVDRDFLNGESLVYLLHGDTRSNINVANYIRHVFGVSVLDTFDIYLKGCKVRSSCGEEKVNSLVSENGESRSVQQVETFHDIQSLHSYHMLSKLNVLHSAVGSTRLFGSTVFLLLWDTSDENSELMEHETSPSHEADGSDEGAVVKSALATRGLNNHEGEEQFSINSDALVGRITRVIDSSRGSPPLDTVNGVCSERGCAAGGDDGTAVLWTALAMLEQFTGSNVVSMLAPTSKGPRAYDDRALVMVCGVFAVFFAVLFGGFYAVFLVDNGPAAEAAEGAGPGVIDEGRAKIVIAEVRSSSVKELKSTFHYAEPITTPSTDTDTNDGGGSKGPRTTARRPAPVQAPVPAPVGDAAGLDTVPAPMKPARTSQRITRSQSTATGGTAPEVEKKSHTKRRKK